MRIKVETVRRFAHLSDDDIEHEIGRFARISKAQGDTTTSEMCLLMLEVFKRRNKA